VIAFLGACETSRPVTVEAGASNEIRAACEIAGRRCSPCHSIERVERARLEPAQWTDYVHRMRLMPSSGIPPQEESAIVQCLVFRTAGNHEQ
jgi:hypothetical protein